jgi:hypothetical protein
MMDYLSLLKSIKPISKLDWGMDRIIETDDKIYTFTYRDKPTSNINDVIHLMIKEK